MNNPDYWARAIAIGAVFGLAFIVGGLIAMYLIERLGL